MWFGSRLVFGEFFFSSQKKLQGHFTVRDPIGKQR